MLSIHTFSSDGNNTLKEIEEETKKNASHNKWTIKPKWKIRITYMCEFRSQRQALTQRHLFSNVQNEIDDSESNLNKKLDVTVLHRAVFTVHENIGRWKCHPIRVCLNQIAKSYAWFEHDWEIQNAWFHYHISIFSFFIHLKWMSNWNSALLWFAGVNCNRDDLYQAARLRISN